MNKLTELNGKLDGTNARVDKLTDRVDQLTERFDRFLGGEGAKLVKRVEALESQVQQLLSRQPH